MAKAKCCYCKKELEKNEVVKYIDTLPEKPKIINVCSPECIEGYKAEQIIKIQERKDNIELNNYIMKIHQKSFLPTAFFMFLGDLRNGTIRQRGNLIKNHKQGIGWTEILNAYKYCEKDIKRARETKEFKDYTSELLYCLAIVKNNVDNARKLSTQKIVNEKVEPKVNIVEEYKYKKKDLESDISEILE